MAINYREVYSQTVSPGNVYIIGLDTIVSPTYLAYGVRTFWDGMGGKNRNFEFHPTHYGVGKIWAFWDGYLTYSSYLDTATQYHFTGFSSDFAPEPAFIYPDASSSYSDFDDSGYSKVTDENDIPVFNYLISSGTRFSTSVEGDLGVPVGDLLSNQVTRLVMKNKTRLYSNIIPADSLTLEVFSSAKQPVTIDIIHIR